MSSMIVDVATDLKPGALIMGRVRGFPWWPAVVAVDDKSSTWIQHDNDSPTRVWCSFFNDKAGAWLKATELRPYDFHNREECMLINRRNERHRKHLARIGQALVFADDFAAQHGVNIGRPREGDGGIEWTGRCVEKPAAVVPWAHEPLDTPSSPRDSTEPHLSLGGSDGLVESEDSEALKRTVPPSFPVGDERHSPGPACENTGVVAVQPVKRFRRSSRRLSQPVGVEYSGPPGPASVPSSQNLVAQADVEALSRPRADVSSLPDASRPRRKRTRSSRYEGFEDPFNSKGKARIAAKTEESKEELKNSSSNLETSVVPSEATSNDVRKQRPVRQTGARTLLVSSGTAGNISVKGKEAGSLSGTTPSASIGEAIARGDNKRSTAQDSTVAAPRRRKSTGTSSALPRPSGNPQKTRKGVTGRSSSAVGRGERAPTRFMRLRTQPPTADSSNAAALVSPSSKANDNSLTELPPTSRRRGRPSVASAPDMSGKDAVVEGGVFHQANCIPPVQILPSSVDDESVCRPRFAVVGKQRKRPIGRKEEGDPTDSEGEPEKTLKPLAGRLEDEGLNALFSSSKAGSRQREVYEYSGASADLMRLLLQRVSDLEQDVASLKARAAADEQAKLGEDPTAAGLKASVEALASASAAFAKKRNFDMGAIRRAMDSMWPGCELPLLGTDGETLRSLARTLVLATCKRYASSNSKSAKVVVDQAESDACILGSSRRAGEDGDVRERKEQS